ncbi:hypothetical protein PSA5_14650 [Pseudomonas syringae pv. actinidiae]|nr:hypothetical protein PSA5_14650 [Pseudomonas syringae pv. actinidiae]
MDAGSRATLITLSNTVRLENLSFSRQRTVLSFPSLQAGVIATFRFDDFTVSRGNVSLTLNL